MGAHTARALEPEPLNWQVAHAVLSRLARERAAADAEEGRWLLAARRSAVHVHLGFGSFSEYVERLFGYQPRSTQEKLRVAEALEMVPALTQALSEGDVSWSAVRELTRVATRATEQQWLELAHGKTLRQLEELLAGRHAGDEPSTPPDLSAQRRVLRFEVAAETFALFRDAMRELRRRSGAELDDDTALLELARGVLAGPCDEGRASYQVVLSVCPACGSGRQHTEGALVPVGPEVVAMTCCDGQHLGQLSELRPDPANDRQPHDQGTAADESATLAAPAAPRKRSARVEPPDVAEQNAHVGVLAKQSIAPTTARRRAHVGVPAQQSIQPTTDHRSAHVGVRAKPKHSTSAAPRRRSARRAALPGPRLSKRQISMCIISSSAPKAANIRHPTSFAFAERTTGLPTAANSYFTEARRAHSRSDTPPGAPMATLGNPTRSCRRSKFTPGSSLRYVTSVFVRERCGPRCASFRPMMPGSR